MTALDYEVDHSGVQREAFVSRFGAPLVWDSLPETGVLCLLAKEPARIAEVAPFLRPEHFADADLARLYAALVQEAEQPRRSLKRWLDGCDGWLLYASLPLSAYRREELVPCARRVVLGWAERASARLIEQALAADVTDRPRFLRRLHATTKLALRVLDEMDHERPDALGMDLVPAA